MTAMVLDHRLLRVMDNRPGRQRGWQGQAQSQQGKKNTAQHDGKIGWRRTIVDLGSEIGKVR